MSTTTPTKATQQKQAAQAARNASPRRSRALHFDRVFYLVEVKRQLRNPYTLVFTLALPLGMYLLFGAAMGFGDEPIGAGNYAFVTMVSMAAFGAATGMTALSSLAAVEINQGWGRQLALTPLSTAGYAAVKVLASFTFASLAAILVFVAGYLTDAQAASWQTWLWSLLIALGGSLAFGLFGLGVGQLFNSDSAAALASISVTVFGFLGNVFVPLNGFMLEFAKFTPMYGYVGLARWPLTEGEMFGVSDDLWALIANFVAWTTVFAVFVVLGVRRSRRRN